MADGYWYFYDHPMEGPPDVVSDIEYADPSIEQVAAPSPDGEYAPPPPGPPPPPPSGQGAVGGAVGAAIGAQAEQRHGYYLWRGVCYYRYPSGQYAAVDPRYCN
jgi:hypothetical protein